MQKTYIRRNWQNYPSLATPLNETNLNAMDYSLDEVDSRVIELDITKLDTATAGSLIQSVSLDEDTGVLTFTKLNGSTFLLQTALGKIAVNFDYDPQTQKLILHHKDGTTIEIDLSALINQYEFDDSTTIAFTVMPNGHIKADLLDASVEERHLQPNYLADIKVVQASARASQDAAFGSALDAEAWAKGTKDGVPVPDDAPQKDKNALFYSLESEAWARGSKDGTLVDKTDKTYLNNSMYYANVAKTKSDEAVVQVAQAQALLDAAAKRLSSITFWADLNNGHLYYETSSDIKLWVDVNTGHLMFEV